MPGNGKTRLAVKDALNGDIDSVDAAVRRALFAICTELDEHADDMAKAHAEILMEVKATFVAAKEDSDEKFGTLEKTMNKGIALLISTTITVLLALGTALLNIGFG